MICPGGGHTTEVYLIRVNFWTITETSRTVPKSYKCKAEVVGTHSDTGMRAQTEDSEIKRKMQQGKEESETQSS